MGRWYRAYQGTVTDAKLHEAAVVADVSRSVAIAAWHCLLEACADARSAAHGITARRVAVILGEPLKPIEALFAAFDELALTEGGKVMAWEKRQFASDSSAERVRKHREAARNADVTLQDRFVTPPDTETDTDTEEVQEDKSSFTLSASASPPLAVVESQSVEKPIAAKPIKRHKPPPSEYPPAFSLLWDCYPRVANQSKSEAFKSWQRLGDRDRMDLLSSVGPYEEFLQKERRRRPEYPACHLVTFIDQRRWEALLEPPCLSKSSFSA